MGLIHGQGGVETKMNKHILTFMVKAQTEFETSIRAVSRGIGIMRLYSVIILSLLMAIIMNVGVGNALASEHKIFRWTKFMLEYGDNNKH